MKQILFQLITSLFITSLLVACSDNPQTDLSTDEIPDIIDDSAAIRATLEGWYAAMYEVDAAGILAPLTPQFLLLEDTLPLSGDELVARLKQGGTETKWSAEFSDFRTRFLGDVAWTTVKNHEIAREKNGNQCQADFLETIVFVRDGERWLIDRYHAAVENPWSCEE